MRRFVVLVVLLAACGGSGSGATTVAEPTTAPSPEGGATSTTAPPPGTGPAATVPPAPTAEQAVELVVVQPTVISVAAAAAAIHETGDERWVAHLVDLIRLTGDEQAFAAIRNALADLTGLPAPDSAGAVYAFYGSWLYDNSVEPAPGYVDWKARLFGLIDPSFDELIRRIDDPVVAARVQWGGVQRAGIPALDHGATISPAAADYMQDGELTFGAVVSGAARAYPHRILDHHELANDTLGGEPVALVNCTLCRTGVLYSRVVDGQELTFETSGLLINSNKIMVDRETETLWEQLTGVGMAGPLAGVELERFFVTVTTWRDWVAEQPDTDVLAIPDRGIYTAGYSYEPGDAYASYYGSDELWFPVFEAPDVFPAKEEVATVDLGGAQLAVSVAALDESGPQLLAVGDRHVVVVPTGGGARFYDASGAGDLGDLGAAEAGQERLVLASGVELPRLLSGQSFWFAWYGAFPETGWWPEA